MFKDKFKAKFKRNIITLRCLEVESEVNHKVVGGAYESAAHVNVTRDGDIYNEKVSNQTILSYEFHISAVSTP